MDILKSVQLRLEKKLLKILLNEKNFGVVCDFLGNFLLTYSLEYHEQVYYVAHGTLDRDTIRCVSFDVVNSNMEPIVILFTEDDLEKMNF